MRWRSGLALIAGLMVTAAPSGVADRTGLAGYAGSYSWMIGSAEFGGFSAIEMAPDGLGFKALTDRGAIVLGEVVRDDEDRIVGVKSAAPHLLSIPSGLLPEESRFDTEGLATDGHGGVYVSVELVTRILHYARGDGPAETLPDSPDFASMDLNGGPEALASDAEGTLYTMPEVSLRDDGAIPVYRYSDGAWDQPMLIAGDGDFLPVGADIGPDGKLYVLERKFYGLGGFASKVRRVTLVEKGFAPAELLVETRPGTFGNLEGISVWRETGGQLRMTMVADDNFLSVLGTELVEFRLPD